MNCQNCGKKLTRKLYKNREESIHNFAKRRFCDRSCMAMKMEGVTKVANAKNGRRQSQKKAAANCEICGRTALQTRLYVHHKDENPMNNDSSNLTTLCGSCHKRSHLPSFEATTLQRVACENCNKPSVKNRLCNTHLSRLKRYGNPLAKKRKIGSEWVLMIQDGKEWFPFPSQSQTATGLGDYAPMETRSTQKRQKSSSKPQLTDYSDLI